MRQDKDLLFLQHCPNEQLKALCDILTHDESGEVRYTECLTDSDAYLNNYPENMLGMWREIVGELQKFGGNSIANMYRRGQGVLYAEIVDDVCRKLKVYYEPSWSIVMKEETLLKEVLDTALDKMTEEEKHVFVRELNIPGKNLTKQTVLMGLQIAMKRGGYYLVPYITVTINYITRFILGRAATTIAAGSVGRVLSFATGPIGWLFTLGWTATDIASPAYRVTIPAVLMVSMMRRSAIEEDKLNEE